jgi:hypothetical protein
MAAGSSPGEAATAARGVLLAEVAFGCGLHAVLAEVSGLRPPLGRVQHDTLAGGRLQALRDLAGRGLLHMLPLAVDLTTALPAACPVYLPGVAWDPVVAGLLATAPAEERPTLVALSFDTGGGLTFGIQLSPEGDATILSREDRAKLISLNPGLPRQIERLEGGVLVGGDHVGMTLPSTTPQYPRSCLDERWQFAVRHGVDVALPNWMELYRLACRYLVPEHGEPHSARQ